MFESHLRYPIRGAWLERTVVGSLLVVGSVFVVPAVVLVGYCLRALETTLEGADEPPAFEDWQALIRTGVSGIAITLTYLFAPLLGGVLVTVVLGVVGYLGLAGLAPFVGGRTGVVWGVSIVAAMLAALVLLGLSVVAFVVYFALPAALARYAATGRLRSAFDRDALAPIVLSREYVLAMGALQFVPLIVPIVAVVCLVTVVGIVALPAIPFLGSLGSCYLLGVAVRRASARTTIDGRCVAAEPTQPV